MSIFQTSAVDLVRLISTANGSVVNPADVIFGQPSPTTDGESLKNTKVPVSASATNVYRGTAKLYYDRLDLTPLGTLNFYGNVLPGGTRIADCLGVIRKSIGIPFAISDLVDTPIVVAGDNSATVLVKASPGSLGWLGEFTFAFKPKPLLSTAFVNDRIMWS